MLTKSNKVKYNTKISYDFVIMKIIMMKIRDFCYSSEFHKDFKQIVSNIFILNFYFDELVYAEPLQFDS